MCCRTSSTCRSARGPRSQAERTGEAGRQRREQAYGAGAAGRTCIRTPAGSAATATRTTTSPPRTTISPCCSRCWPRVATCSASCPPAAPPRRPASDAHLSTEDVMQALARMQAAARDTADAARSPRTVHDVRQALLAQTRQMRGEAAALSTEDNDTFELLSILLGEIQRELRQDAPSNRLLHQMVVPLLQLVLQGSRLLRPAPAPGAAVAQRGGRIRCELAVGRGTRSAAQRPAASRRRGCGHPLSRRRARLRGRQPPRAGAPAGHGAARGSRRAPPRRRGAWQGKTRTGQASGRAR